MNALVEIGRIMPPRMSITGGKGRTTQVHFSQELKEKLMKNKL
jgi:hypothetical protein